MIHLNILDLKNGQDIWVMTSDKQIRIRVFSSFTDSTNCKQVYERLCETLTCEYYGNDKKIYITDGDDYTHVIIQNTAMPNISHIPRENVLGIAFEPPYLLNISKDFIEYSEKYISKYLIGDKGNLPSLFYEHFGFMWHMTPHKSIPIKNNCMSIAFSDKKYLPGHKLRHDIVEEILKSSLPIDIYGRGCILYQSSGDSRLKGEFYEQEPYNSYNFNICIENIITNHYFSEKIMNPLLAGTTPIYYGARNINVYFPGIVIKLPDTIDEIMKLLTDICQNPEKYKKDFTLETIKEKVSLVRNIEKWFS